MHMPVPPNSIPMKGADAPFGYTDMGGMLTLLKVRDELPAGNEDPGWYLHPPSTVAGPATAEEIAMLGSTAAPSRAATTRAALYACPMHEEVSQRGPGRCPECEMALEPGK